MSSPLPLVAHAVWGFLPGEEAIKPASTPSSCIAVCEDWFALFERAAFSRAATQLDIYFGADTFVACSPSVDLDVGMTALVRSGAPHGDCPQVVGSLLVVTDWEEQNIKLRDCSQASSGLREEGASDISFRIVRNSICVLLPLLFHITIP